MKQELSEGQISLVEDKLTELGLVYLPLKEEFLDHICCLVESELEKGQTIEQAMYVVFEAITKDELKELQQQTIFFTNQKSRRMKNVMSLFSLSIVILTGFFFFLKRENNLTSIQPPSPDLIVELPEKSLINGEKIKICTKDFFMEKKENLRVITAHDPPDISPLNENFKISAGFGLRTHPVFKTKKFHRGIDFIAPIGTPILATANGIIFETKKQDTGYGYHILIKHDEQYKTLYAHLNEILVSEGQKVQKGELIGTVGTTGNSSGPHLHYEVIKEGKRVNPIAYCQH